VLRDRLETHLIHKHLIDMCVNGDANKVFTWHEVIPVAERLKCIVYESDYVALLAITIGIT
jgi:hypothetical protein